MHLEDNVFKILHSSNIYADVLSAIVLDFRILIFKRVMVSSKVLKIDSSKISGYTVAIYNTNLFGYP